MKLGVLGGTFDPPHIGHLRIAEASLNGLGLDEVILMPAARNPLKERPNASGRDRLEMVRRLVSERSGMAVSDLEITKGGASYAVETMAELQMARPAEYWFIVGADAAKEIGQWKQPAKLLKLCRLGVVLRRPLTKSQLLAAVPEEARASMDFIEMEPLDVSATDIRDRIARGLSADPWIPPQVLQYIKQCHLYGAK